MAELKENFRKWLVKQGLSEKTSSGRKSTVYDYIKTIDRICKNEGGITWEELASNIFSIIDNYQGKPLSALNKYDIFLIASDIPSYISLQRFRNILYLSDKEINKFRDDCDLNDFLTTDDLASILNKNIKTIKRWRKNRINQNKLEQPYENPDGVNPIGPRFIQIGGNYFYRPQDVKKYLRIDS